MFAGIKCTTNLTSMERCRRGKSDRVAMRVFQQLVKRPGWNAVFGRYLSGSREIRLANGMKRPEPREISRNIAAPIAATATAATRGKLGAGSAKLNISPATSFQSRIHCPESNHHPTDGRYRGMFNAGANQYLFTRLIKQKLTNILRNHFRVANELPAEGGSVTFV